MVPSSGACTCTSVHGRRVASVSSRPRRPGDEEDEEEDRDAARMTDSRAGGHEELLLVEVDEARALKEARGPSARKRRNRVRKAADPATCGKYFDVEVVEEPSDEQHDQDEEPEGERGIDQKDAALAPREDRDLDVEAQDVSLEQGAEVGEGVLAQLGDLEEARERVVAVDLPQGVDVEEERRDAGEEHRLVRKLVQQRVRIGRHPQEHREGADDRLDVHARERRPRGGATCSGRGERPSCRSRRPA